MSLGTKPLYGRLDFGKDLGLSGLIGRLEEIAARFLDSKPFSAYLLLAGGQSYYGLTCEELEKLYLQNEGKVTTLSASASSPQGTGLNLVINFAAGQNTGIGRFMIAAGGAEENLEIRDLLLGIWEPRPGKANVKTGGEEKKEALPFPPEEISESAPADEKVSPAPEGAPVREQTFFFDPGIPVNTLVDRLYDLFIQYLDDATFEVQLLTYDSDRHLAIQVDHLRNTLKKLRGKIKSLSVDLQAPGGYSVKLLLSYAPFPSPSGSSFRLQTLQNEEIEEFILAHFAAEPGKAHLANASSSELFAFDPKSVDSSHLISAISFLAEEWLAPAVMRITLLNRKGGVHLLQRTEELRPVWGREKEGPSLLDLHISRPASGQTIHLMLDFDQGRGSLYQLMGSTALQTTLREQLFQQLQLHPWSGKGMGAAPPSGFAIQLSYDAWMSDPVPNSGLVLLPHQDGLADEVWYELQKAMQEAGFSCYRAESLFGYMVTEKLWTLMLRAEVVVADLSEQSAEVFYLLGMAHSLGKNTLLIAREAGDIPFDFKKYSHLLYQASESGFQQLRRQLTAFLKSEKGSPPPISG